MDAQRARPDHGDASGAGAACHMNRLALASTLTYWQAVITVQPCSLDPWPPTHRHGWAKELLRGAANDHSDLRPFLNAEAAY